MNAGDQAIQSLFHEAKGLPTPEARADFLQKKCGDNVQLRQRVEALLEAHFGAGTFLEHGADSSATVRLHLDEFEALTEKSGDRIGRYKLLERIGEGAFGQVWMAEQEQPVRRRVALKIVAGPGHQGSRGPL